ncbi:NB-ARC domain-containing protein [Peribacillus simplex]|uniref:NB-ARC domain-containing protein n=2 Tax=Peribacillus TaxID=2675229 RepID=A0AA90NZ21_9BACI|nr:MULTISPECIES: NB-ARC domain-containing protein [Peribacillus]MDP1417653.1 NB-ARC domain-containing protein [Peribacillus simplex]MDP1450308.1 NB-ARC domain-containing protein [Peribacillus frigoritolerans]
MNFPTLNGQYTISSLIAEIQEISKKRSLYILAIDGRGGSGKSTLASSIQAEFPGSAVVHMDDFYLPSSDRVQLPPSQKRIGADYDWERVYNQILKPLTSGEKEARYQRYDWETDTMAEWHEVPAGGLVIIEGTYSIREEWAGYHDFTIWVECPRDQRLKRGLERDGEDARQMWEDNWMVQEDLYVGVQMPQERANLIVDGTS